MFVLSLILYITLCPALCTGVRNNKDEAYINRIRSKRSTGSCGSPTRLCCPDTDDSCYRGCYCDEYCLTANDCCPDYKSICQFGPCNNYTAIDKEEKRSSDYFLDVSSDVPISDEMLNKGWYRVLSKNGEEMPTNPPGVFYCGTENPIWLNGTFPTDSDTNFTTTACLQTVNDTCEQLIDIQIVNCSEGFYVYYLQNTTRNSAYCFGSGRVRCYEGLSSDSGYYPGCSSSFPNETIFPFVQALLIDGPPYIGQTPSVTPAFLCLFDDVSNGSYVYDVTWYINGDSFTVFKNIPFDEINSTALTSSHWENKYRMNMEVFCSVRSRFENGSLPSQPYQSEIYAAGLFPEHYDYTVIEGESINVTFSSTVPVACISASLNCRQSFYIFQPTFVEKTVTCSNNFANRDVVFRAEFCGFNLGSRDWTKKKTLEVYGFSDGLYNHLDRSTYIRISTSLPSFGNDIWANISIPDIKVTVLDKDAVLTSRVCQSYNDPHFTTFDGKVYHYMDVGEYALYRNSRGPYWVHALFTACGYGWTGSSCNCGIAIRSRSSLFVLRTCAKISRNDKVLLSQPHTEIRSCYGSDLTVQHTGNDYKIILPIGTEIRFSVNPYSKFIPRISIKPSIYDINRAEGLCGVPSSTKDTSDDFKHRNLGTVADSDSFADSWRINSTTMPDEALFVREPEFLSQSGTYQPDNTNITSTTLSRYCACERQAGAGDNVDEFYTLQCNLTESTEQCTATSNTVVADGSTVTAFVTSCSSTFRRKRSPHRIFRRSVYDSDDVVEFQPLDYDENVFNTGVTVPQFRNGWTEEKANQTCNSEINQDVPVELLATLTDLDIDKYMAACALDIKATANKDFLKDTVGAMQTFTLIEVSRNETLTLQQADDGSQSVLEYITSLLCPNNCTGNGNCTSGVCLCYSGYAGEDCSGDISIPPNNISLPSDGICVTNTRSCRRTNIYGTFQSTNIWSKQRYFQIINNTLVPKSDPKVAKAEYRNAFMVSVNLQSHPQFTDWFTADGYEISLSNDGTNFGETVSLIIYDEDCMDCNTTTTPITCVELDSCPALLTTTVISSTESTEMTSATTKQTYTTTDTDTTTTNFETLTTSNIYTSHTTSDAPVTTLIDTSTMTTKESTITETTTVSYTTTTSETSTTVKETTLAETTTVPDKTTTFETSPTIDKTTIPETTTVPVKTTTHETSTTVEETTIPESTTVPDKRTSLETRSTTDSGTTFSYTTMASASTSTDGKTTAFITDIISTKATTTVREITSELSTTSDVSTISETEDTNRPSDAERLVSYTGPMVIGASVVIFSVVVLGVFIYRKIAVTRQTKMNDKTDRYLERSFDGWKIYTGKQKIPINGASRKYDDDYRYFDNNGEEWQMYNGKNKYPLKEKERKYDIKQIDGWTIYKGKTEDTVEGIHGNMESKFQYTTRIDTSSPLKGKHDESRGSSFFWM